MMKVYLKVMVRDVVHVDILLIIYHHPVYPDTLKIVDGGSGSGGPWSGGVSTGCQRSIRQLGHLFRFRSRFYSHSSTRCRSGNIGGTLESTVISPSLSSSH